MIKVKARRPFRLFNYLCRICGDFTVDVVERKPMDLGYILEVRLAGLVERLDGEGKSKDAG